MDTQSLIDNCSEKYTRAFSVFSAYADGKIGRNWNGIHFIMLRGFLYSFFESRNIIVNVHPYEVRLKNNIAESKWTSYIYIEGEEIRE